MISVETSRALYALHFAPLLGNDKKIYDHNRTYKSLDNRLFFNK